MSPVIELGEMRHGESADEPEPAPPRRPPGPAARVALLGVLVLLVVHAAAGPPRRPVPIRIPAPQGAAFVVRPDRVVVADGPG
ncbi:hypothetical protein H9X95_32375, partial [Micromonospora chalcea]|nr:hypothetical protein [Micromonospora chalcea]